jgi:hypothetical protein
MVQPITIIHDQQVKLFLHERHAHDLLNLLSVHLRLFCVWLWDWGFSRVDCL